MLRLKPFPKTHDFPLAFARVYELVVRNRSGHERIKGRPRPGRDQEDRLVDDGGGLLATNYAEDGTDAPDFPIYSSEVKNRAGSGQ